MLATRTELVAENGIVVSGHRLESAAGVQMLARGGNAVDAVVAAAFTAFVVEPASCGVGGYGHLAIFFPGRQELITFDHNLRAPRAVRPDMFEIDTSQPDLYYGWPRVIGRGNEFGYLAPAVPGAVAGLCAAHEMFGRLPLTQVLEPAIEAAEAGLPVTWDLALAVSGRLAEIQALPQMADLLLPEGRPPRAASILGAGDRLDFSELAGTLRRIARDGATGFYQGPVAEAIERELAAHGGILTAGDLAAYRPKIVRERPATYRRYRYITANDQVGYEALNILDHFDLTRYGPGSVEFFHLMAEAMGHAFADNLTHYGDPDCEPSRANGLASRRFGAGRAAGIRLDRAAVRPIAPADPYQGAGGAPEKRPMEPSHGGVHGTAQVATADRDGNVTALITSLSFGFGSLVLVPGTGVFLNNGMVNFDPRPGRPNSLAPGKMPIFAVPALIAVDAGRAVFVGCGSGGYRILSGVLHTMVNALDFRLSIQAAVDAPRIHCQGGETFADARVPLELRQRLRELGHEIVVQEDAPGQTFFGRVAAIAVDPKTRALHAGSGPAWSTAAAGL